MVSRRAVIILLGTSLAAGGQGANRIPAADLAESRAIFKQLIEINTTDSVGSITAASDAMAARFLAAGFPGDDVQVIGPNDRKKNLLVRYGGSSSGKKPVLIVAHLDVVEALRSDWTTDPFQFVGEGRLLLRARHTGHERGRRHPGGGFDPAPEGGLQTGSRYLPGADGGRRGRQLQWRGVAAGK